MAKKKRKLQELPSWRDIPQSGGRNVVTPLARRRVIWRAAKVVAAVALVVATAGGAWYFVINWSDARDGISRVLPGQPLREIIFNTDGVLPQDWVENHLGLELGMDVMALDLHRKKALLERHGQVRNAVLRRHPERLEIVVQERIPVARVRAAGDDGLAMTLLVDRDGVLYEGVGFLREEIADLPFLDGIRLRRHDYGFERLAHIDVVADLLRTARDNMPHIYNNWRVVDCSRLPDFITVRSADIREIIFSRGRYLQQLQWLDIVIESNRSQMITQARVDLSHGTNVILR